MATLASLVVRIAADAAGFHTEMSKAERRVTKLAGTAEQAGRMLSMRLTAPLALVGAGAIKAATDIDSLTRGLTAVAGSATDAQAQLARLREVAKMPGLGFQEAIQGSIRLQAAGLSAQGAEKALSAFGNALATVGAGKAELDRVTVALGQIAAKGKVSAEEINQLNEVLPQIRQAMNAAFGTSDTEALQKMGIDAQTFISKVTDEFAKLPKVSAGARNSFENFADAAQQAGNTVGSILLPSVTRFIDGGTSLLEHLREVNPALLKVGVGVGVLAAALGPLTIGIASVTRAMITLRVTALLGSLSSWGSLALSVRSASDAFALLGMSVSPASAVVLGLGVVAAAFVTAKMRAAEMAAAVRESMAQLTSSVSGWDQKQTLTNLNAARFAKVRVELRREDLQQQLDDLRIPGATAGSALQWKGGVEGLRQANTLQAQLEETEETLKRIDAIIASSEQHWIKIGKAATATTTTTKLSAEELAKLERERVSRLIDVVQYGIATNREYDQLVGLVERWNTQMSAGIADTAKRLELHKQITEATEALRDALPRVPEIKVEIVGLDKLEELIKGGKLHPLPTLAMPGLDQPIPTKASDPAGRGFFDRLRTGWEDVKGSIGDSLKQMFDPKQFFTGLAVNAASSLAGVLAQGLGDLFGDSERERATKDNTVAMERLRAGIAELGAVLGTTRGSVMAGVETALQQTRAAFGTLDVTGKTAQDGLVGRLKRELGSLGLTMDDLSAIAAGFNINLKGENALAELLEALQKFQLKQLFTSTGGQLDMMRREFELFGTESGDQLSRVLDLFLQQANLGEFESLLKAFDLSSAAGLEGFQKALQDLFMSIGSLTTDQLGELSINEMLDLIMEMNRLTKSTMDLEDATRKATEQLLNIPRGFKVALSTFRATTPTLPGRPDGMDPWTRMPAGPPPSANAHSYAGATIIVQANDPTEYHEKMERGEYLRYGTSVGAPRVAS